MKPLETKASLFALAAIATCTSSFAEAQMPTDQPFSMRGVELGITIDEFLAASIPVDEDQYRNPRAGCSNGMGPHDKGPDVFGEDKAIGIVQCEWYSQIGSVSGRTYWSHWIKIGNGSGIPTFRFIEDKGQLRLFEITFYANNKYHPDILDALTRGYGQAEETVEPFKTKAGGNFTSLTSVWDNILSSITLVERCDHLERYCLTYRHTELSEPFEAQKEALASQAAKRI